MRKPLPPNAALRTKFLRERYQTYFAVRHRPKGRPVRSDDSGPTFQTLQPVKTLPLLVPDAPNNATVGNAFHELLGMRFKNYDWTAAGEGRRKVTHYYERLGLEDSAWPYVRSAVRRAYRVLRSEPIERSAELEEVARLGIVLGLHAQVAKKFELVEQVGSRHSTLVSATFGELMRLGDAPEVSALSQMLMIASEKLPTPTALDSSFVNLRTGHGEADLLLGNTLIEVKTTTSKNSLMDVPAILQLLGYALSITPRTEARIGGLDRAGWYLARQGILWDFPIEDLVRQLSDQNLSYAQARGDFGRFCRGQ